MACDAYMYEFLDEITEIMCKDETMTDICDELVKIAKAKGGNDNITMVVVEVTEEDINE